MLTRIEEETRQHHGVADGHRLTLLEVKDEASYASALVRIAGFERSVEAAIANAPDIDPEIALSHTKSDRLIAQDLPTLGSELSFVLPTPGFADPAQALAWLYMLHRNTLVHRLIVRQLALRVPQTIARASAYLSMFEGIAGQRLGELGQMLEVAARSSALADRIVLSAHDAFRAQRQWYTNVSHTRRLTPPRVPLAA